MRVVSDPLDEAEEQAKQEPASSPRDSTRPSEPPGPGKRRRLEGVIPELIKRAVEIGVEKATDAPETVKHFVADMKLPKEAAAYILQQIDDTKNGVLRVVAKEVRDFLEHTNIAREMQKILTTLQFEINTTIRFRPNKPDRDDEGGDDEKESDSVLPKPEVKLDVYTRRTGKKRGAGEDK
jgi:hypothetical protein